MILNKKKYKKTEVEALINAEIIEYEAKINALKERIQDLSLENSSLKGELLVYKEKEESISYTLKLAQEKALETVKQAEKKYTAELVSLKSFSKRWKEYFVYLSNKYPMYPAVTEAKNLHEEIEKCVSGKKTSKEIVLYVDKLLKEKDLIIFSN